MKGKNSHKNVMFVTRRAQMQNDKDYVHINMMIIDIVKLVLKNTQNGQSQALTHNWDCVFCDSWNRIFYCWLDFKRKRWIK